MKVGVTNVKRNTTMMMIVMMMNRPSAFSFENEQIITIIIFNIS